MHARKVSHKILDNACPWMHAHRRNALIVGMLAAIEDRRLSVTGLGRAIDSPAKEKHCIKRADRLIGNRHLYREYREVYRATAHIIIGATVRPVILVDWSDLDPYRRHFLLRASVAMDGRALSLYEEVHGLSGKDKPRTHKRFIQRLRDILPAHCHPIIVTDAGFRTPWFQLIETMGWDWVGRIRNRHMIRYDEQCEWFGSKQLYSLASSTPKYLGCMQLTRSNPHDCHMVLYKNKAKGRSRMTRAGQRARSIHSKRCAQRGREPWLLATSLPVSSKLAKKVVNLYACRMQIEESFRDVKSIRYGLGFELNMTRSLERLQVLLMVAMLATLVLWLLGMAARRSKQHRQYQANSIKTRHVLSAPYLGLRVANDRRFRFDDGDINTVGSTLPEIVASHGNDW